MFDPAKVNKEVPFRFYGEDLRFFLSHGLFSSFDIDAGSKLLLKALAQNVPWEAIDKVYDIGCGVGTLGLSIAKKFPNIQVFLQDRDALAVHFSRENARRNKLRCSFGTGLALLDAPDKDYDLILSNIPAKAGEPVLKHFIDKAGAYLSDKGIAAIVIVSTLADWAEAEIRKSGGEILHQEKGKQHTVILYKPVETDRDEADINTYIRHSGRFTLGKTEYHLSTVYNIPNFDTPSFELQLVDKLLKQENIGGKVFLWNPGQGHLGQYLRHKKGSSVKSCILAGRDSLSLQISRYNLGEEQTSGLLNVPDLYNITLEEWKEAFSFGVFYIKPITKTPWNEEFWSVAPQLFPKKTRFVVYGKSSDIATLLKNKKGVSILNSLKEKGKRAILLEKA